MPGLLPAMQGTVKYPSAMLRAYNSKTTQARHSDGLCKAAGKALLQMCHGKLYPCHLSRPPHCQGDAGNKPGVSAPPSMGRGGWWLPKPKKGGEGDARMDQVLLSCRSLGRLHTDKLRAESGGRSLKHPDCESSEGGSLSDYYIILGWSLWAGQLFGRGSCDNVANVTYL